MARNKTPDLNTKTGRYALARLKTKTKKEAAELVGMNPSNVSRVEASPSYQAIVKTYFKDALLSSITMEEMASKLAENIRSKEGNVSNNAIKLALERVEPETTPSEQEKVVVILKPALPPDPAI
jgi:hypothetical protein